MASGATLVTYGAVNDAIDFNSNVANNIAVIIQGTWNNNPGGTGTAGFERVDNLTLQGATINDSGQTGSNFGAILMAGTVTVSGSAASTYNQSTGGVGMGLGTTTFNVGDVTGNANVDFTVNGVMRNTAVATGSLNKTGLGTMLINGSSTYSGGTTVSNGTLLVANTAGSATGTGTVTVNNGATLSGSSTTLQGFITGQVNVNGGGNLSAFSNAVLTIGSTGGLTLDADASTSLAPNLNFTLGTLNNTSNALINVTKSGGLVVNSNKASTITVTNASLLKTGTYDLIGYNTSATGLTNFNGTVIGPISASYSLMNNTGGTQIDLVVTNKLGVIATDKASNYSTFSAGGSTPASGGSGYGNWSFANSSTSSSDNGEFLGSSSASPGIDTGGNSFGLYGNSNNVGGSGAATANAIRGITNGLTVGQTFAIDLQSQSGFGGSQGVSLQNGTGTSGTGILQVFAQNGHANYQYNDSTGQHDSGIAVSLTGARLEVTLTANSGYSFTITPYSTGITSSAITGTASAGSVNTFRLFDFNSGNSNNAYFNSPNILLPTWNGVGVGTAGGNFSTAANWAAHIPVNGGSIAFDGTGSTVNNDNMTSVYNILFNGSSGGAGGPNASATTNAGAYTLTGIALTINGGIDNNSTSLQTINNTLTLGAAQSFNATSGKLAVGGTVHLNTLALTVTGANNVTFGGVISGTGAGSTLTYTGTGTLALNASNSYTGATAINTAGGTLQLGNANAIAGTSSVTVVSGAVLDLNGQAATSTLLTIAGTGISSGGAIINSSGTVASLNAQIDSTGTNSFSVGGTGNFTLNAQIGPGTNTLNKVGSNTVTLSGVTDNTNLSITATSGKLILAKTSTSGVHAEGSGLTLSGGTVQLGNTSGDQIYDGSGITVNTGTFDMDNASETINTLNGSGGSITNTASGTSILTVGDSVTATTGSGSYAGAIQDGGGGKIIGLTKGASGTLTLSGANAYSGSTTVSAGKLLLTGMLGNTAINVASAATFAPQGASVTAGSGSASLSLAGGALFNMTDNTIGTFNLVNTTGTTALTVNSNSGAAPTLTFEIGNLSTGTDKIAVTGKASVLGVGGAITITQLAADTVINSGNYNLITTTGTGGFSGIADGFTLNTTTLTVGTHNYTLSLNNSTANNLILSVAYASPTNAYWNATTNNSWATDVADATNWQTTQAGGTDTNQLPGGATTNVFFTTTAKNGGTTSTLDGSYSIASLNFTSTTGVNTINAGTGGTLTIAAGGIVNLSANSQTLNTNVVMGAAQTFDPGATAGGSLVIGTLGTNTLANGGFRLTVLDSNNTTINSVISGTGDFLKQGTGSVFLNGANTFGTGLAGSNNMFIDQNVVNLGNSTAAGNAAGSVTLGSSVTGGMNAFLNLTNSGLTVANPINIRYLQTGGKTVSGTFASGTSTYSGNVTLADHVTLNSATGGTLIFSGVIAPLAGGTLSGTPGVGNIVNAAPTGGFSTSGPGVIINDGSNTGIVEYDNAMTYLGDTVVDQGTLQFNGSGSLANSSIRLGNLGAATLNMISATGSTLNVTVNVRPSIGLKTISASNISGTSTLGGHFALDDSATVTESSATGTLAITQAHTDGATARTGTDIKGFTLTLNPTGIINISGDIYSSTGVGSIIKTGSGTATFSGVNTYTGTTTVNAGVLQAGVTSVANVSGAFGNNSAVTMANVAGATLNITGFNTQIGSLTGGGTTGGNVVLGAATLSVGGDNTSPAAYAGIISGTGGGLSKIGTGTLTLTAASTGGPMNMTVNNGTLKLAVAGMAFNNIVGANQGGTMTIGSSATLELNQPYNISYTQSLLINGGTLNITANTTADGANYTENVSFTGGGSVTGNPMRLGDTLSNGLITVNGTTAATISANIDLIGASGKSATFNIVDPAGNLTVSGIIQDFAVAGLPVFKTGSGKLTLTGANTYTGGTTISAGTLQLGDGTTGHDGKLANGVTITDNAALVYNLFGSQTYSSETITGSGTLTKNGAGTLTFDSSSPLSYTGGTILNGGTLRFDNAHLVTGPLTINSSATFILTDFAGTTSSISPSQIDLTGGTINGFFASANVVYGIYTNSINIHGSGLISTIAAGSATTVNPTPTAPPIWINIPGDSNPHTLTLTVDTGATGMISSVIGNHPTATGAGSLIKAGAGTLTLSGASIYTGGTFVNAGVLKAGVASVAGASGAFGLNSAVTLANATGTYMDITGFNTQIGSLTGGGATGGSITLGAATLSVGGDNTSPAAYAGIISGTGGGLTKIGTGTLTLTGSNTYTGTTTVTAGSLLYSGGALAAGGTLTVGGTSGSSGTMTLSSGVGTLNFGPSAVGSAGGNGTLNVNAGTIASPNDMIIATSGTGSVGVLNIAGGVISLTATGRLIIGDGNNAAATVNLNSGTISNSQTVFNGGTGQSIGETGTFNLNGGTLTTAVVFRFNSLGTFAFNFNGGTLKATQSIASFLEDNTTANNALSNSGAVTYAVADNGAIFDTAGFSVTVGHVLTHGGIASTDGGLTLNDSAVTKGTLTLTATNTYTGNTVIKAGKLILAAASSNNIANSAAIIVGDSLAHNGAVLSVTGLTGGTLVLASGQTLGGSGTVTGAVTIANGSTLSPGNSPGTISTGAQTWAGGGNYLWQINTASTTVGAGKGVDPGYDWTNLAGALTITATSGSLFNINIVGLTTGNVAGAVAAFDPHNTYDWVIASANTAITTFSAADFALNTSAFTNNNGIGSGSFSIVQGGSIAGTTTKDMVLVFNGGAVSSIWSPDADGNWSTSTNWTNLSVPNGIGDTATFGNTSLTAPRNVTVDGAFTVGTIAFNAAGTSNGFTLATDGVGGHGLTLNNNGIGASITVSNGSQVISAPMTLADNLTVIPAGSSTLTLSGIINETGGARTLTMNGAGTLVLSASNTYSGLTTISGRHAGLWRQQCHWHGSRDRQRQHRRSGLGR